MAARGYERGRLGASSPNSTRVTYFRAVFEAEETQFRSRGDRAPNEFLDSLGMVHAVEDEAAER
jgi:hypothetical protein